MAGTSDQLWKGLDPRTPPPCSAATLGVTSLLEGPAAGSDSSIVLCSGTWNSSTGTSWIHTSSSGTGNGLMTFTFDSNGGGTRSGSITVSNATLNITQAPSGYVNAGPVQVSTAVTTPYNIAVDSSGNVYIADSGPSYPGDTGYITKWNASTGQASTLVSTGGESYGVVVDGSSNVYVSDALNSNVKKWIYPSGPANGLSIANLSFPQSLALNSSNLYIADTGNNAIKTWALPSGPVTILCQMAYAFEPYGVAVDLLGNVYFTNYFGFYEVTGSSSYSTLSTSVKGPQGLAVDGGGNSYIADSDNNAIKKWNVSAGQLTTWASTGFIQAA